MIRTRMTRIKQIRAVKINKEPALIFKISVYPCSIACYNLEKNYDHIT